MEENPLEPISAPSTLPKRKINKRFIYLVLAILFLAILFIGYKALNPSKTQTTETTSLDTSETSPTIPTDTIAPTVSETSTPTPTNTPTPKPTVNPVDKASGLDRSKLSITVQNGSGEEGVAGKASDVLKDLGYEVVSSGNADNYDYTDVVVQVKSSSSDFLDLLKKDLGFSYTVGSATSDLADSFSSDALVIIGK